MSEKHVDHSHELERYFQQMQMIEQEKNRFAMKRVEIEGTKRALSEVLRAGENTEVMFPLGSGVFLRGTITDAKNATVSVGAEVAVQKTIPDAEAFLNEQLLNLNKAIARLEGDFAALEKEARGISKTLERAR